MMDEIKRQLNA